MFLRATNRIKDGKEHRYWSVVENRRLGKKRTVQKTLLYLGEINDTQQAAWCKSIDVIEGKQGRTLSLFPDDRRVPEEIKDVVQVRMNQLELHRPRQWGACWLACELWQQLDLDSFWREKLGSSRKGTDWKNVLQTLVCYQLIEPGSEWRLHRLWFDRSAMAELLDEDFSVAQKDTLYRCLDKLLEHKKDLFSHLRRRWETLFNARFDVLLYDLTSTYFESIPPFEGKRQFGYSRDKRSDCVQVVIALVVTPDGFPLAYEVMPGNTSDKTTLSEFLKKIEDQYGQADRVWVMDRGIPTEEVLSQMRSSPLPMHYLVGTPKGRLNQLEKDFLKLPWSKVRESVEVKLLPQEGELYVLAKSKGRIQKERAMRRRQLKKLWGRLKELQKQKLTYTQLLLKIGAAKKEAGRTYSLVQINLPENKEKETAVTFTFSLRREKLSQVRRREGHYLLRSNLCGEYPAILWQRYIQLTQIEEAFKNLKSDLSIRPIFHQKDERIEAHIFVAFLAYCLQVTLKQRTQALASGLTPRSVLEQLACIQMIDVHVPTTDGRWLTMARYTQPEKAQQLLLNQLQLTLPKQPPPKITTQKNEPQNKVCGEDLSDF